MRIKSVLILSIFSLFVAEFAAAEVYYYTGAFMSCQVEGDRREIGLPPVKLDSITQSYGFQLFRSEFNEPMFTAFGTGDLQLIRKMLDNGGVPNRLAPLNWTIDDQNNVIKSEFLFPKVRLPVEFFIFRNSQNQSFVRAKFSVPWDLSILRTMLTELGDKDVPDFRVDVPAVSWTSTPTVFESLTQISRFSEVPTGLFPGNSGLRTTGRTSVQIHYKPSQFNGLSYHIYFSCEGPMYK